LLVPALILLAFLPLRPHGLTAGISLLCLGIGPLLYNYLPVASEQNPPMNWGYARSIEGFWHALARGQFEKISLVDNLRDILAHSAESAPTPVRLLFDPRTFTSLPFQFNLLIAPVAILPLFMARHLWLRQLISVVPLLGLLIWWTAYPKTDLQTLFICRPLFIPVYVVFTPLLACGLALALAGLTGTPRAPAEKFQ
jgi:hypothetical protein